MGAVLFELLCIHAAQKDTNTSSGSR